MGLGLALYWVKILKGLGIKTLGWANFFFQLIIGVKFKKIKVGLGWDGFAHKGMIRLT